MKIKVIGIGGAGNNTISRLYKEGLKGVEFFAVNTDAQALNKCLCPNKILIGEKTTKGLGAGMDYNLGLRASRESKDILRSIFKKSDIVFLTCGLGGGSGTPAISVLGELGKEMGVLTFAVVTTPFSFEGSARKVIAQKGLKNLQSCVDAFLVIPNDRILKISPKTELLDEAFRKIDNVLLEAIQGISELLSSPGIISIDFADLEEVLKNSGRALFGQGIAKGEQRAVAAVSKALQTPLLDIQPQKAKGILFSVSGRDVSLTEVNMVANFIKRIAGSNAKIIFGVSENKNLNKGEIKVILIAAGIEYGNAGRKRR